MKAKAERRKLIVQFFEVYQGLAPIRVMREANQYTNYYNTVIVKGVSEITDQKWSEIEPVLIKYGWNDFLASLNEGEK